ncbi:MAG: hypothetical protein KGJ64_00515 [Betaproteobacteria bacterium]|nr:hypothetical protein [Betaproteobacteria bacterium]
MTRIQDKLAQSVRQARCAPAAARTPRTVAKPGAKPAAKAGTAANTRPVTADAPVASPEATAAGAGVPRESSGNLFPQRVWPD